MTEAHWREWARLVEESKSELQGNCPLLCDETIIKVNEYLLELKKQKRSGKKYA